MNKFLGKHGDAIFFMAIGALFATGITYVMGNGGNDLFSRNKNKDMSEIKMRAKKALQDLKNAESTAKENSVTSVRKIHNEGVSIKKPYEDISRNQMIDKGGIYPGSLSDLDAIEFPYGDNYGYHYLDKKNRQELATHLSFATKRKPVKIGTGTYQHTTSNPMIDSNTVFSIIGDKY